MGRWVEVALGVAGSMAVGGGMTNSAGDGEGGKRRDVGVGGSEVVTDWQAESEKRSNSPMWMRRFAHITIHS